MSTILTYPLIFALPFLLAIVGTGLLLIWVAERSPARAFLHSCGGISAPFPSLLALLFGLFSAFLANDVSTHTERARTAVFREANAIAVVLTVSDGLGERGTALKQLAVDFGQRLTGDDWRLPQSTSRADALIKRMLNEVLSGSLASADSAVRQTAIASIKDMQTAHSELVTIAHSDTAALKWIAALFFGILTQMSVAVVHFGKPRAGALAMTLFSIGMAFMLWVVLVRLDPFTGKNTVSLAPITGAFGPFVTR